MRSSVFLTYTPIFQLFPFQIPQLYANKKGPLAKLKNIKALKQPYVPPWWCPWGFFQTIFRQLVKDCPSFPFERDVMTMEDGGQVALDWLPPKDDSSADTPIVIILPGLTGDTFQSYVLHLVEQIQKIKLRSVVFNNRGNGGVELLTPQTYCASYTDDLRAVVNHVQKRYPQAPCMAVGFSLGGMIVYNYLASVPKGESGLKGAMCVSSPWNPILSSESLERFWPRVVFNKRLAKNLCDNVIKNRQIFEGRLDFDELLKSNVIREFDERFIVPMFGYKDVKDYYHDAGLYYKTHQLSAPVLLVNAEDDCFAPIDTIPIEDVEKSENVGVIVTAHGGHIAFMKDLNPRAPGLVEEIFCDYAELLLPGEGSEGEESFIPPSLSDSEPVQSF